MLKFCLVNPNFPKLNQLMTELELKNIEKIIKEAIDKTLKSIAIIEELTKPIAPENAIGRISRMDAINNKSVNDAALTQAKQKLKNLEITLSNLYEPEFGISAKCNNTIPLGRIMLMPQSRFCVNCAS